MSYNIAVKIYPVIIVGAGVSGLAAAHELKRHHISALVLEARDRMGGRLWTSREYGYPVELGAQVLHTPQHNPLAAIARKGKLKKITTHYGDYRLYRDRHSLSEQESRQAQKLFSDILNKAVRKKYAKLSVLQAMKKEGLEQAFKGKEDLLQWALASSAIFSGAELDRLSVRFFEDANEYDEPAFMVPKGLDQILRLLAKPISKNVKLGQVVHRIVQTQDFAEVRTNKNTFRAKKVLVTLPLGVLKAGRVRFEPALPKEKTEAIKRLGFGVLDLMHLEFPYVFWPHDKDFIGIAGERHFPRFFDRCKYTGRPVLDVSMGASTARKLEGWSDQKMIQEVMIPLRKIFGPTIPKPIRWKITRWAKDPYALGSYSNLPVKSSPGDRKELAKSVASQIYFAGEATEVAHPGTLHGAYLSGQREARRMAAFLTRK